MTPTGRRRLAEEGARALRAALDRLREEKKVEKKELDELLGRGKGYHSHLFSGRIGFTVENLFGVLLALDVPLEDFLKAYARTQGGQDERLILGLPESKVFQVFLDSLKRLGLSPGSGKEGANEETEPDSQKLDE